MTPSRAHQHSVTSRPQARDGQKLERRPERAAAFRGSRPTLPRKPGVTVALRLPGEPQRLPRRTDCEWDDDV